MANQFCYGIDRALRYGINIHQKLTTHSDKTPSSFNPAFVLKKEYAWINSRDDES